jgi:hypothetical protein
MPKLRMDALIIKVAAKAASGGVWLQFQVRFLLPFPLPLFSQPFGIVILALPSGPAASRQSTLHSPLVTPLDVFTKTPLSCPFLLSASCVFLP